MDCEADWPGCEVLLDEAVSELLAWRRQCMACSQFLSLNTGIELRGELLTVEVLCLSIDNTHVLEAWVEVSVRDDNPIVVDRPELHIAIAVRNNFPV